MITDRIKGYLEQYPLLQDSDMHLIATVWWNELKGKGCHPEQYQEFFTMLRRKELTHPESIMRSRRKVQEEHEHLRGDNYKERQGKQEDVKKDLGY